MTFKGPGDSAIHTTQVQTVASLLRRGMPLDDVVATVLEATKNAVANDPSWNWQGEQFVIEQQGADFIAKNPELSGQLNDRLFANWQKVTEALAPGERPTTGINRFGAYFRGPHSVREPIEDKQKTSNGQHKQKDPGSNDAPNTDAGNSPRRFRFKLVSFADLRPGPEPLYLVDELIPVAGLVDVWGKAKCYKSFWCLDLMLHVAMGWEYRDRYVRQGAVVYCAFEGAHGYKKRVEALRRHYNIADGAAVPLYVMPGQANLIAEHESSSPTSASSWATSSRRPSCSIP